MRTKNGGIRTAVNVRGLSTAMWCWTESVINTGDNAKRRALTRKLREGRESPRVLGQNYNIRSEARLETFRRPPWSPGWWVWQEQNANST